MLVNNEIGVVQDIAAIGEICRERAFCSMLMRRKQTGKVAIDLQQLKVDLMMCFGAQDYGPKGIARYMCGANRGYGWKRRLHGGGHDAACVPALWRPIQSLEWRAFRLAKWKWRGKTNAWHVA